MLNFHRYWFFLRNIYFWRRCLFHTSLNMLRQVDEIGLVQKVKAGDRIAFASLYHLHVQRLCLISFKITGDKEMAEDVVQDFFVNFWLKKELVSFTNSFGAYASRSVYNASLNAVRNTKKIVGLEVGGAKDIPESLDLAEEEHLAANRERLSNAIEKLPPQCRKIFETICLQGSSYADAATSLGISVNTVKVHMSKAYRMLKEELYLDKDILFIISCFFLS